MTFVAYSFQNLSRLLHNRHVSTSRCRRRRRLFLPFQNAGWEAREGRTVTATAISQIPPAPSNPPTQAQLGIELATCQRSN